MKNFLAIAICSSLFFACSKDDDTTTTSSYCTSDQLVDQSRGACGVTLTQTSNYNESVSGDVRTILANSIPGHAVGLFGSGQGALNPNPILEQAETYNLDASPSIQSFLTPLLITNGLNPGPQYSFGILFNGVELDPVAAEPFPHEGRMNSNANWEWNLEALNTNLGLDCNNAHVQPNGKYHYHGKPTSYLEDLNPSSNEMTLVGYAADGFPIYYKYAYEIATDIGSAVVEMTSSWQLKSGQRPGDGVTAPCGEYDGVYSADYGYVDGSGTLDEANGRSGVTPEFPLGTYYYVITDDFPSIPRFFRGTPSNDFKIGM